MYAIEYSFYIESAKKHLESRKRKNLTLEDVKDKLKQLQYDNCSGKHIGTLTKDGMIVYSNGDECTFQIYYNGKFCKKYSRGVK